MFGFGSGTLPLLMASGIAANRLRRWTGLTQARFAAGALLVLAGTWTIAGAVPTHTPEAHTTLQGGDQGSHAHHDQAR